METFQRIDVLGCPFDAISFTDTARCIRTALTRNTRMQIVTGNIDFVMKARRDPDFSRQLWQADLVVPDGVPILWAARLLGSPLRGRVNGTDLVWKCAEISAQSGHGIALVGGREGVAVRAAGRLEKANPGALLYPIPTPYPLGPHECEQLVRDIRAVKARIVLVALGAPLQERWIRDYLAPCGANVGVGVGGAFDIISGDMPRAPKWLRENGFEWLHRLGQEPKRLGRRYLVEDTPFFLHLFLEMAKRKRELLRKGSEV